MSRYEFKRGDTFDLGADATLQIDGAPADFSGVTIEASLAQDNGQGEPIESAGFASIAGEWLDQGAGLYHVAATKEDTATWPLGKVVMDVALVWSDGRRVTTPTLPFVIVPRVPPPA